ncbi:MAG: hypothetical protein PHW04_04620 [Candidatus Wallbacteria bacterium]|nr:hypothetical protein [Candidatus Wallbacteria bacterium]
MRFMFKFLPAAILLVLSVSTMIQAVELTPQKIQALENLVSKDLDKDRVDADLYPDLQVNQQFQGLREKFRKNAQALLDALKSGNESAIKENAKTYTQDKNRLFDLYRAAERNAKKPSAQNNGKSSVGNRKNLQNAIKAQAMNRGNSGKSNPLADKLKNAVIPGKGLRSKLPPDKLLVMKLRLQLKFLARSAPQNAAADYGQALKLLQSDDPMIIKKNLGEVRNLMKSALVKLQGLEEQSEEMGKSGDLSNMEQELTFLKKTVNLEGNPVVQKFMQQIQETRSGKGGKLDQQKIRKVREFLVQLRKKAADLSAGEGKKPAPDKTAVIAEFADVKRLLSQKELSDADEEVIDQQFESARKMIRSGNIVEANSILTILRKSAEK